VKAMAIEKITEQEIAMLEGCNSAEDWKRATMAVKEARGGAYPPDWYEKVIAEGLGRRVSQKWGARFEVRCGTMRPAPISSTAIMALAAVHVTHFERLCRQGIDGASGIRLDECAGLLRIWRSIVEARGCELAPDELAEVLSAIESQDFDDLIPPADREAYERWVNEVPPGEQGDPPGEPPAVIKLTPMVGFTVSGPTVETKAEDWVPTNGKG